MKPFITNAILILHISILFTNCYRPYDESESISLNQDTTQNKSKVNIENIFIRGEIITGDYLIVKEEYNCSQYLIVKQHGLYGLIDDSSKIVLPIIYDRITSGYYGKYFYLEKNGLTGVVTYEGDLNIPIIYKHIEHDWNNKPNDLECFIVQKENKLGSINFFNNIIIPIEYDGISNWVEYGPDAHYIKKDSLYGLVDYNSGKLIIPPIYQFVGFWNNDCITVRKNRKFGVINIENKIVIPIIYDKLHLEADYESNAYIAYVEKDEVWYAYNSDGMIINTDVILDGFDDDDLTDESPLNANDQLMVLPE